MRILRYCDKCQPRKPPSQASRESRGQAVNRAMESDSNVDAGARQVRSQAGREPGSQARSLSIAIEKNPPAGLVQPSLVVACKGNS